MSTETSNPELTSQLQAIAFAKVCDWCRKADVHPTFPMESRQVVEILTAISYAVDVDVIDEFITKNYFAPVPGRQGGRLRWTAHDLFVFGGALEFYERWLPSPCVHDPKKSHARLGREQLSSGDAETLFAQIDQFTIETYLLNMTRSDDPRVRAQIAEYIRCKLERNGYAD